MGKVKIITDTDCSLPPHIINRYQIHQVPIIIHFNDASYASGEDIDDTSLFKRIDREGKLPTTSAPSPGEFIQAYQAAFEAGADTVICYCVSSKVSATYNAALTARETMDKHDITVVVTQSHSMGQGFTVLAASEAAAAGATKQDILSRS